MGNKGPVCSKVNLRNLSTICFQLVKVADRGRSPTRWQLTRGPHHLGPFRRRLSQLQAILWIISLIGRRVEFILSQIGHYYEFYFAAPLSLPQLSITFVVWLNSSQLLPMFAFLHFYIIPKLPYHLRKIGKTTTTVNSIQPQLSDPELFGPCDPLRLSIPANFYLSGLVSYQLESPKGG